MPTGISSHSSTPTNGSSSTGDRGRHLSLAPLPSEQPDRELRPPFNWPLALALVGCVIVWAGIVTAVVLAWRVL